ncbi:MAG: GNAT family N-acetyltransferase [Oligoflexales bacterium]|nr:GNAT family N-acetyltransferase [Oligoflexales bacterium]
MSPFEDKFPIQINIFKNDENECLKLFNYSKNWDFWPSKELSDFLAKCKYLLMYAFSTIDLDWCGIALFKIEIDSADLIFIHVKAPWRKQAVASQLIQLAHIELLNRKVETVVLEVRAGNLAAQKFYKKHNYEYIARRNKYYADNLEDALIFRRSLSEIKLL